MKCPSCGKEGVKYITQKKDRSMLSIKDRKTGVVRSNFDAKCKHCKWEGEI